MPATCVPTVFSSRFLTTFLLPSSSHINPTSAPIVCCLLWFGKHKPTPAGKPCLINFVLTQVYFLVAHFYISAQPSCPETTTNTEPRTDHTATETSPTIQLLLSKFSQLGLFHLTNILTPSTSELILWNTHKDPDDHPFTFIFILAPSCPDLHQLQNRKITTTTIVNMWGSYGSYSSISSTSSSSSAMDIRPGSIRSHGASCAFPSWPRRSSLDSEDQERPTSFVSDDDLMSCSDTFEDDRHSVSSSSTASSISPPHHQPVINEAELRRIEQERMAMQREFVQGLVREKERRQLAKKEKMRRKVSSSSKKSPNSKLHHSMTPIAE